MWANETELDPAATVAPTLYGLGATVEQWARGVLDLVGDGPLVLVGNSIGGSCALEMAYLAPERVAAIVLVGAKAGHRPQPDFRDEVVTLLRSGGIAAAWAKYWAPLFGTAAPVDVIERARQLALAQDVEAVVRGTLAFHSRPDRSEFVRQWRKPLVVVSGDQDRRDTAVALAASAPLGELHLVADAGHYVPLEQPGAMRHLLEHVTNSVGDRPIG